MLSRWALIAAICGTAAFAAGCGSSAGGHVAAKLDARALVVQPHAVGGVREVRGSWTELGDDGSYPLADAFQGRAVPRNIAFVASYAGVTGAALERPVFALAVVLPDAATARRLLRASSRIEGFIGDSEAALSGSQPPGKADAAVAGTAAHGSVTPGPVAIVAWTTGRLYGYVTTSGDDARVQAARIAAAQEALFEHALAGDALPADASLRASDAGSTTPFPLPVGRTVHPSAAVPRIDRPGRYTLQALGVGRLVFSPSRGGTGVQFPVTLALPPSARGTWLWRITTHVVVTLAEGARTGHVVVYPHISNTGAPGAQLVVAHDLGNGRTLLVETTRHTPASKTLEITVSAMMGGHPTPRQDALVGFSIGWSGIGAERALERVTVLPDSAIEVFDDPAKIGVEAMSTTLSRALP